MGTLTLSDFRDEVSAALGNRNDLTNSRIDRILNMSQERIARRYRFDDLIEEQQFDIASNEVALPSDVHKIYHLSIRDKADTSAYTTDLVRVPKKTILQLHQMKSTPDQRRPTVYARYGNTLRIYASPDVTYLAEIVYSKYPTALSGDGDTSDFDLLDDAIIALAVSWLFSSYGNPDEATRWFRIFQNSMKDAVLEENENPDLSIDYGTTPMSDIGAPRYYEDPFAKTVPR